MSDPGPAARVVACPSCGRPASLDAANRWRPFCCERCRLMDLGAWATESYRVAGKPPDDSSEPEGGSRDA